MSESHSVLVDRIRGELEDLERIVQRALTTWEMAPLIQKLPLLWPALRDELSAFADFMEQL